MTADRRSQSAFGIGSSGGLVDWRKSLSDIASKGRAYLASDETTDRLRDVANAAKDKARDLAESDEGKKAIARGRRITDELLDHMSEGDSATQAAAKTAKTQLHTDHPTAKSATEDAGSE
jgi:hypothetical protein